MFYGRHQNLTPNTRGGGQEQDKVWDVMSSGLIRGAAQLTEMAATRIANTGPPCIFLSLSTVLKPHCYYCCNSPRNRHCNWEIAPPEHPHSLLFRPILSWVPLMPRSRGCRAPLLLWAKLMTGSDHTRALAQTKFSWAHISSARHETS